MTAYQSNGERSKSPSGQQGRVTEGDKDESPRVTRTSHPGGQKRGFGKNKKIFGKGKKHPPDNHSENVCCTYMPKQRPLPGQVEAFTCSAKGLCTEWGCPKCETRSLAPKAAKIRKLAVPSPHTTIRQKAQVVRL